MTKFIPILNSIISEQKRDVLSPQIYSELEMLTNILWKLRNKVFNKRTFVTDFDFKVRDGENGKIGIYINPRLKYIALLDKRPKSSTNPKDYVIDLNPKEFGSKKNLFLTLYHEYMHATDPNLSTKQSDKYMSTYSDEDEKMYWGHPIEFRAITNEFLEAFVLEFKRRLNKIKTNESKILLKSSLDNIVSHFQKSEKLSNLSLDILKRMNDEGVLDNRVSNLIANIQTDFPESSELIPGFKDPYFLVYINKIKEHNPIIWSRFLKMFYKTVNEVNDLIKNYKIK